MPWNYGRERWWREMLTRIGAVWVHDGNPERPYALLTNKNETTGKRRLSNVYFDGARLSEHPQLLKNAAEDLIAQLTHDEREQVDIVCGSPYGSIMLAFVMALRLCDHQIRKRRDPACVAWFTEPVDSQHPKELALKRFGPSKGRAAIVVDDAFTTGGTSLRTTEALRQDGARVLPVLPYLVNRTGKKEVGGYRLISLIDDLPGTRVWDEGENPYTGGKELVEPVKPKLQWDDLTRAY